MKSASVIFSFFISVYAQAGSHFLNATFESKILGDFQVSLKVTEFLLPIKAVPETSAIIDRDNGQIVSMNCVTTAPFLNVGQLNLKISNAQQIIAVKNSYVDVSISNSYEMKDSAELCHVSPLHEASTAVVAAIQSQVEVPILLNGETYYLSVSAMPFSMLIEVVVSGDENSMSLDWVDLFTPSIFIKPSLNYSIYQKSAGSISYLESGWVLLNP